MTNVKVRLKDGRIVVVRKLQMEDKKKLVEMYASLSDDALRWAMPPYLREGVERWLSNLQHLIALIAISDNEIVGHAQIYEPRRPRRKGVGDLLIYLNQGFHNVGLGTAMLTRLIELAEKKGVHRIGLSVVADNKLAVYLYQKLGFKIEGIMKDAYFGEDGKYHDELVMGLILATPTNSS